jgi:hypothetical protein
MRKRRHIWMLLVVSILALPANAQQGASPKQPAVPAMAPNYAKTGRNN